MSENRETIISLQQLKSIFIKEKKVILSTIIICCTLAASYALLKPIEYIAEGTFKDKGKKGSSSPSLAGILSGGGQDNNAIALMKSRMIKEELVKALELQAELNSSNQRFNFLKTAWKNIVADTYRFFHPHFVSLADSIKPLRVSNVSYLDEVPRSLTIHFKSEDTFEIHDNGQIINGEFDQPITNENYHFTLHRNEHEKLNQQTFNLTLWPLNQAAKKISENMSVDQDRQDKNLINITFKSFDRHLAANGVNTLMSAYKKYLQKEQDLVVHHQIRYLEKRQEEISKQLKISMESHVLKISDDIKNIGFPNTTLAMEFLTGSQNNLQKKLLDIEFELKRLFNSQEAGHSYFDTNTLPGDPTIINEMMSEMRDLKQQSDWLNLNLQDSKLKSEETLQEVLTEQLALLKTNRDDREDARKILEKIQKNQKLTESKLLSNPKYLVKTWISKMEESKENFGTDSEDVKYCKSEFCSYLKTLIHHFDVQESTIQERIAHGQTTVHDFQGIDLKTTQTLFVSYTHKMNEIESQILQNQFIIDEMDKPNFDLSALNTILTDPVSQDMSQKATLLALNLKDSNNRSLKEQERIKEDLDLQKRFLSIHLKSSNRLLQLNEELMKYKVKSLQSVTLGLVQQQISLLENNLSEFIRSRIKNLKSETEIIEQHKLSLMNQMSTLPSKWVSEQLIHLAMNLNQKMVEEVSKLVEKTNIENNLEIIQSTVIDPAVTPIHPKPAKIFFFALLGSFIGLFSSLVFVVTRNLKYLK